MSGILSSLPAPVSSAATSLLPGLSNLGNTGPSWQQQLVPAKFRDAAFYVLTADRQGGRRLVPHVKPFQNEPYVEDLGRAPIRFRLRCFVVGDGYMAARDALIAAVETTSTRGTLVHPYYGQVTVRAGLLRVTESRDEGGYAAIEVEFHRDGAQPGPNSQTSTASTVLSGVLSALPVLQQAYALGSLIASNPGALLGLATNLLGGAATSMLGLPAGTLLGLQSTIESLAGSAGTPATTAALIASIASAAATNVLAASAPDTSPDDPVLGNPPVAPPSADPSGGLAGLAAWGAALPPIGPLAAYYSGSTYLGPTDPTQAPAGIAASTVQQAVMQQQIVDLVTGAATLATAQIYAGTDFVSSNAAAAARTQLQALFDARVDAAANADQPALFMALRAVEAMSLTDLITRAQSLPSLANYTIGRSMPALALAQLWYQDPARADELVQLNDAIHPLFMPTAGVRLSS